jgi:hypothetical protein
VPSSDGGDGGESASPSSASSSVGGGGNVGGAASTGSGAQPPPPGPQHPGDGPGVTIAFSKIFLGDTDRQGNKSASAWKAFGFDIDGKISTEASTDLCKPHAGGKKSSVYPDGNNGIDNGFGKNMVPILTGISADFSGESQQAIATGQFTLLVDLGGLGTAADYNPLVSRVYRGGELGAPPKFDGTDAWPVRSDSLLNPSDVGSAKITLSSSYVTGNIWVSGLPAADLELPVPLGGGASMSLVIHHALLAMDLGADHQSGENGTISGVLDMEEFIGELKKVAGAFSPDLCSGSTIEAIANQLRQGADIMKDGSPGNPAVECDGISIGLGFEGAKVELGAIQAAPPPSPDPCAPQP